MIYRVDFAPMYPNGTIGDHIEGQPAPTIEEAMQLSGQRLKEIMQAGGFESGFDAFDLTLSWREE